MNFADLPIWLLFVIIALLVVAIIELGNIPGTRARRRSQDEKESPDSARRQSRRSAIMVVLAMSFSMVMTLIAALDNREHGVVSIP